MTLVLNTGRKVLERTLYTYLYITHGNFRELLACYAIKALPAAFFIFYGISGAIMQLSTNYTFFVLA